MLFFSLSISLISFRFHPCGSFQVCLTSPSLVICRKLVPNSRRLLSWTDTTNRLSGPPNGGSFVRSLQHPEAALLVFSDTFKLSILGKIVSMIKANSFCTCATWLADPMTTTCSFAVRGDFRCFVPLTP